MSQQTQYQKIEKALRHSKCTSMELIHMSGSTCPWRRLAEMKARGWPIREGFVKRGGRELRCWWLDSGDCEHCGEPNPPGKARKYCSDACRAKAWRS